MGLKISLLELIEGTRFYLQEESSLLASPEEAAYFRTFFSSRNAEKAFTPPPSERAVEKRPEKSAAVEKPVERLLPRPLSEKKTESTAIAAKPAEKLLPPPLSAKPEEKPAERLLPPPLSAQPVEKRSESTAVAEKPEERLLPPPEQPEEKKSENAAVAEKQSESKRERPAVAEKPVEKLHPLSPPPMQIGRLKGIVQKVLPHLAIIEQIPSDAMAKKIANLWKAHALAAPISILFGEEPPQHQFFLKELASALTVYYGEATLVSAEALEKEKEWEHFLTTDSLRFILLSHTTLWQLTGLRSFYKEMPGSGVRLLHKTPLFLLPDLSLYFKDPLLKQTLWGAINAAFYKENICPVLPK
ncbi:MAG: hypothetical protein KGI80_01005 [Verrucomicrobiota bacterium]|nr:hypothetical protein [Verrucomicrobiota bacterium]